jgi:hypothetical protein
MLKTGLEFDPGTTNDCKALVERLFQQEDILSAYQSARAHFKTGDLVLRVSEQNPSGFEAEPRIEYIRKIREVRGEKGIPLLMRGIVEKSAHGVVRLPFEADAMWLIVVRGPQEVPAMCVIYAAPYEVSVNWKKTMSNAKTGLLSALGALVGGAAGAYAGKYAAELRPRVRYAAEGGADVEDAMVVGGAAGAVLGAFIGGTVGSDDPAPPPQQIAK